MPKLFGNDQFLLDAAAAVDAERARIAGEQTLGRLTYSTRPAMWAMHWTASHQRVIRRSFARTTLQRHPWNAYLASGGPFIFGDTWSFVLWPIPLLLFATAIPILRSGLLAQRRAMTGRCATCGYSLAGLAAHSPCPECGSTKATT